MAFKKQTGLTPTKFHKIYQN